MSWAVQIYDTATATWISQTNIQNVNISSGRRYLTDPYGADRATYSGYISSNMPDLVVMGASIRLKYKAQYTWYGNIADVAVEYGISPNEDYVTVTIEGLLAKFGRTYVEDLVLSSSSIANQVTTLAAETGVTVMAGSNSLATTQTYTGNALDLLNTLMFTEYAHIYQYATDIEFIARQSWGDTGTLYNFTDSTTDAYSARYDKLEFDSAAENYYNRVVIEPQGLAAQTAEDGTTPPRSLVVQTLDYNTSQAYNHALYLLNNFDTVEQTITAVSCTDAGQPNDNLGIIAQQTLGQQINVVFRGTTYVCIIEGVDIAGRPGETRFTFNVSPQDMNAYFRLGDPAFGTLNNNKLGF